MEYYKNMLSAQCPRDISSTPNSKFLDFGKPFTYHHHKTIPLTSHSCFPFLPPMILSVHLKASVSHHDWQFFTLNLQSLSRVRGHYYMLKDQLQAAIQKWLLSFLLLLTLNTTLQVGCSEPSVEMYSMEGHSTDSTQLQFKRPCYLTSTSTYVSPLHFHIGSFPEGILGKEEPDG